MMKILYSPEEYGGGGVVEGDTGESEGKSIPTSGGGETTGNNEANDVVPGVDIVDDDGTLGPEQSYWNTIRSRSSAQTPEQQRVQITNFTVSSGGYIAQNGDTRLITIQGTPGAMFSLTIKDSSGCSILEDEINNVSIPDNGTYELTQEFPSIFSDEGASKTSESYNIECIKAADVYIDEHYVQLGRTLYQYANPTITVTTTTSQTGPTLSVAGGNFTESGKANSSGNTFGISTTDYTLTLTEGSPAAGQFYVDANADFESNLTNNTVIKKVVDRDGETGPTHRLVLSPLTTRTESTIEGDDFITGDLKNGMRLRAKLTYTKTVRGSLDKDGNIIDLDKCKNKKTNRIKLSDTNDLIVGMPVSINGKVVSEVVSIDCDTSITIFTKIEVKPNTSITFTNAANSYIGNVVLDQGSGQTTVNTTSPTNLPQGTVVEFDDNESMVYGAIKHANSGTDTVTLTIPISIINFGLKNVTYTLDLDNFITRKPNAYDQTVSCKKNSSGIAIDMLIGDFDSNATSKTGTVVRPATHGTVSAYTTSTDTFRYIPNNGFTGEDSFTFTMSDGTNSSDEKTVTITVK